MQSNTKYYGVIDIGSVAIRAEVLAVDSPQSNTFSVAYAQRQMPKLGVYDKGNVISEKSLKEAEEYLSLFSKSLKDWKCEQIVAVGTAVFRQASNSNDAVSRLEKALNLPIKVIDEVDEAVLISEGIFHFEPNLPSSFLLLDIGGRSSEISLIDDAVRTNSISLPFGAISIQSEFFESYLPGKSEESDARIFLQNKTALETSNFPSEKKILVGSSGTLRMAKRMIEEIEGRRINLISVTQFRNLYELLLIEDNPLTQKLLISEKNRKELVYSGLIILDEVVKRFNCENILISKFSLRHGLLKRMMIKQS